MLLFSCFGEDTQDAKSSVESVKSAMDVGFVMFMLILSFVENLFDFLYRMKFNFQSIVFFGTFLNTYEKLVRKSQARKSFCVCFGFF